MKVKPQAPQLFHTPANIQKLGREEKTSNFDAVQIEQLSRDSKRLRLQLAKSTSLCCERIYRSDQSKSSVDVEQAASFFGDLDLRDIIRSEPGTTELAGIEKLSRFVRSSWIALAPPNSPPVESLDDALSLADSLAQRVTKSPETAMNAHEVASETVEALVLSEA